MTNKLPVVGKRYKLIGTQFTNEVVGFLNGYVMTTRIGGEPYPLSTIEIFSKLYEELPEDKSENHWQDMSFAPQDEVILLKTEDEIVEGEWVEYLNAWFTVYKNGNNKRIKPVMWKNIEDKAETKPEAQSLELSPKVKEAMEGLRNTIKIVTKIVTSPDQPPLEHDIFQALLSSRNLLNALDNQFANNKIEAEEVFDNKIEEESIWKPVSELPEKEAKLWVKRKDGNIVPSRYDASEILQFSGNCLEDIHSWCYLTDFINEQEKLRERVKKLENKLLSEASINKISDNS